MRIQRLSPPLIISGHGLLKGSLRGIGRGRGLHAETAQSALTVISKFVISGLTSVIFFVLIFSSRVSPGPNLKPNCNSLCCGYSLVTRQLTPSTWWVLKHLQDSSMDMAQSVIIYSP